MEIVKSNVQIENKQLARYTQSIFTTGATIKKSYLKIASIIATIDDKKLYESQFGNLESYGKEVLGLKKAQTYAIRNVGKLFVDPKTKESVLPHDDKDYSISQLQAMLPLKTIENAETLTSEGLITPDNTVKEIKETVREFLNPHTDGEGEGDTANDESQELIEAENAFEVVGNIEILQNTKTGEISFLVCGEETDFDALIKYIEVFNK